MGTRERRERERQETRQKILDAAREMFATEGIEATTMRAIAERIEYTPTAIYHHFKDKDSLIRELCHSDFLTLAHRLQRDGRITDCVERLRSIGRAYVDFGLEHPHHYRIMFMTTTPAFSEEHLEEMRRNPEEDAYGYLCATVRECIETGRLRPELTDVEQVAQLMWAGVHGVVSLRMAKANAHWISWADVKETSELMIETQLRGMLRDPASA